MGGDGNVQEWKSGATRRATTTSERLAAGLGLLCSMLGLDYSLDYPEDARSHRRPKFTVREGTSYDVRTSREDIEGDYEGFGYHLTVQGAHHYSACGGNG